MKQKLSWKEIPFAIPTYKLGGGNLYNPTSKEECLTPITTKNYLPSMFHEKIPYKSLLISKPVYLAKGTNNRTYKTNTKARTICYDKNSIIPLVLRRSVNPLTKVDRDELIELFQEEIMTQIHLYGIMPDLYMFGTYLNDKTKKEYLFSIMYRGVDLHKILYSNCSWSSASGKSPDASDPKEHLKAITYKTIETLGQHLCNLDIKPANIIVSDVEITPNTYTISKTSKIFIIDVDPYFVLDLTKVGLDKNTPYSSLNTLIMKYLFAHHIKDHDMLHELRNDPQYDNLINVYDHFMLNTRYLTAFKQIVEAYNIKNPSTSGGNISPSNASSRRASLRKSSRPHHKHSKTSKRFEHHNLDTVFDEGLFSL